MAYPGGDYFIGVWSGGKAFLTDGLSPYSQEVQTQLAAAASDWDVPPLIQPQPIQLPILCSADCIAGCTDRRLRFFPHAMDIYCFPGDPLVGLVCWTPGRLAAESTLASGNFAIHAAQPLYCDNNCDWRLCCVHLTAGNAGVAGDSF
jgi:hypothetical protein